MITLSYYYSATTNAFYPEKLQKDYEKAGSWPDDVQKVDEFIYSEYAEQQPPAGKMRVPNADGYPSWGDIPPPTTDQLIESNTRKYNKMLRACTDAAFPLQSAVALGVATDEQKAQLAELQQYAIDLINPELVDLTQSPPIFPNLPACIS